MGDAIIIPILGIIWPFAALIVFVYLYFQSRNKIRMALIESGRDASIFKKSRRNNQLGTLKAGVIAGMGGMGILAGSGLEAAGMQSEASYFSAILIFLGIGLIGFYVLVSRKVAGQEDEDGLV